MPTLSLEKLDLPSRLVAFFQSRSATLLCFLIALLNKSIIAWIHTDLEGDKSLYLLFAQSMLDGKGALEPIGFNTGSNEYAYNQAIYTPVYSLLALPFLAITGSFMATSFCLDVISWGIFFSGLYKMSSLLLKDIWIANVLVLCSGFFLYPHELESAPKDVLAIGLILWTIYLMYQFIRQTPSLRRTLFLSITIIAFALVKFLYLPVGLLFIGMAALFSAWKKSKAHLRHVVVMLVLCVAVGFIFRIWIGSLQRYQNPVPVIAAVNEFVKGTHPENLLQTFPFLSASLLNINFWSVQLQDIFSVAPATLRIIFQVLDLVLFLGLIFFVITLLKRGNPVLLIGLVISALILFILGYMSVKYEGVLYPGSERKWTYVQDPRSYLFPIILVQIILFYFIFKGSASLIFLRNFLLLLFLIECLHGAYFTTRKALNSDAVREGIAKRSPVKRITRSVLEWQKESGTLATVATADAPLRRYVQLHGIPVKQFRGNPCLSGQEQPSYPILFVLYERDSSILQCSEGKLTHSDLTSPFVLLFYEGQKKN